MYPVTTYLDAGHMLTQCLVSECHIQHPEVVAVLSHTNPNAVILLVDNLFG